jgi:hypothetical protein
MRQRHLGSDVERLALITLILAESRAVGAAQRVSRPGNTPSQLAVLTQRSASGWGHSVLVCCVNTVFKLPLTGRTRAADRVEVLGRCHTGHHD